MPERCSNSQDSRRASGTSGTHASLALAAGISPKVVSERLGHATVSITLDTYSHAIPALQEEAAERIAGLVLVSSPPSAARSRTLSAAHRTGDGSSL